MRPIKSRQSLLLSAIAGFSLRNLRRDVVWVVPLLLALLLPLSGSVMASEAMPSPSSPPIPSPLAGEGQGGGIPETTKAQVQETYGTLPLYFIQNDGQVDEKVRFYEKGSGHGTYFTKEGVYLWLGSGVIARHEAPEQSPIHFQLIKLIPLNANKNPEIIAVDPQEGKVNYFVGSDPGKWKTNIATYKAVIYKEIYPGIDLKFYGNNRQLEYDIIVKPGADLSKVRFAYEGIEGLRVTENGDLEIILQSPSPLVGDGRGAGNKIFQKKPVIYQEIDGKRVEVEGRFKVLSENVIASEAMQSSPLSPPAGEGRGEGGFTYTFELASYDKKYHLIIDPTLFYATFIGGSGRDMSLDIALDNDRNVYIVGVTISADFPTTPGAYDRTYNGAGYYNVWGDVFVVKLDATGSSLSYATYIGGSEDDWGSDIALDSDRNAYVTGRTGSTDFPTTAGAYDTTHNGGYADAFIVKLNAAGSSLSYATFLGGSRSMGYGIALDSDRNAYVTGWAFLDFPTTPGAYSTTGGGVFVSKLDATGSSLFYSARFGSSFAAADGTGVDIALDGNRNAYVTGWTESSDFPTTPGAYDTTHSLLVDSFAVKLDSAGSTLIYSTYLGGSDRDYSTGIVVDIYDNAYVTGQTSSSDFPTTPGAYDTTYNGNADMFAVKLDSAGSSLSYSTYIGDDGTQSIGYTELINAGDIALDSDRNAYIAGLTFSSGGSTFSPGGFVAKLDATGSSMLSLYFLGRGSGNAIALDSNRNIYVTGDAFSDFITTPGAYDTTYNGGSSDAFIMKMNLVDIIDNDGDGWDASVDCDDSNAQINPGATEACNGVDDNCDDQIDEGCYGSDANLSNISTRARVETGANVMIGGFIISGTVPRSVLIRGFGPTLADFGVTGAMANPYIELYSSQTLIATNDDWQTPIAQCDAPAVSCGTPQDIQATGKDACTVATTGCSQDAAILVTLPPGAYTAIMRGVGGGTGVGLIGVDDNDTSTLSKLVNISTRGPVLTGDSVMIGGFIVGGSSSKQVLIRGFGPTLTDFGVTGALANPYVELYSGQTMIATNDNWQTQITQCDAPAVSCGTPQDIQTTGKDACSVATTGCSQDAAILVTLPPGAYTAIVRGVGGVTGVGLVGIDEIGP